MQISKLRLSGFKSFVQPTELFIEAGLTGIVGPNGCGKSNLVDALRWVMGESSAKGLRGGEMDDVIFAGTNARPAFDLAEVALHMQAGGEPIPGFENEDELELTRRIGRGMGSVYRVNGNEVRAKDVQLLFADNASGARSAAIVSQGKIGALVEAKPAERRKLLEEAAGISGLQARRHEAELKLQGAEANLLRVEDMLINLDEQFATLQKQAKQASRYRKLQEQHRETEAALLIGRWQVARAELARAEEALRTGRGHVQVYASRLAEAKECRETATENLTELRREEAVNATDLARLGERRNAIDAEAARFDANQTRLKDQERQTVRDLEHAEEQMADAKTMVEKLGGEQRAVTSLIEDGGEAREEASAQEVAAREALEAFEKEFRDKLGAKAEIEAQARQVEGSEQALVQEQQSLSDAKRDLDQRMRGLAEMPAAFTGFGDGTAGDDVTAEALEAVLAEAMAASEVADERLANADEAKALAEAGLSRTSGALRETEEAYRSLETEHRQADSKRQALADRHSDLEGRIERLKVRQIDLEAKAAARGAVRGDLAIGASEQRVQAVEAALADLDFRLAKAKTEQDEARSVLAGSDQQFQEAQTSLDKLEAEALALSALLAADIEGPSMLDRVHVEDGYAEALAAALGDDLLGGDDENMPTFWRIEIGSQPLLGGLAKLPDGTVPLADKVMAPAVLSRRLSQVGLVEKGDAERLQHELLLGQRLVSTEGELWRWDGLVRKPEGAKAAAARVKQQARRKELETELKEAFGQRDLAEEAREQSRLARQACRDMVERLETEREAERLTAEAARRGLADLRAKETAIAAELGPLGEEIRRLGEERAELEAAAATVTEELATLDADSHDDVALDTHREQVANASIEHEAAKQVAEEASAVQQVARHDAAEGRKRTLEAQEKLEQCRAHERRHAALLQERAVERAQIEDRLTRLAEDRQRLEARLADEMAKRAGIDEALRTAASELETTENALSRARRQHEETKAADAALRDRYATASQKAETLQADLQAWTGRIEASQERVEDLVQRRKQIIGELADLAALPDDLLRQQTELKIKIETAEARRDELAEAIGKAEKVLVEAEQALQQVENDQVEARESGARLEAHLERAQSELETSEAAVRSRLGEGIEAMPGEPPSVKALNELEMKLARVEASRERLGAVNLRAIDEAAELDIRIQTTRSEKDELIQAIDRLRRAISTLNREGRERLRAAFGEVEQHFEKIFARLFGGGRAKLELTDMEDPLNAGLELSASPPGKKLQSLSLLSGGEKAMTAIALIFAVFLTRPSPLCLLDEVDAPLDDANVNRLGAMLEELATATSTRFVVVTHHPMTMSRMDRLFGVTMMERGVSQLVGVDLRTAEELRATA